MNWKTSPINPAYAVSDCGQVKRISTGRIRAGVADKDGYFRVGMWIEGRLHNASIHRLVATAFIANPLGKRLVNHIDGDKQNNRVENLEWVTDSESWIHAIRTGLSNPRMGRKLSPRALVEIRALSRRGLTNSEIAARYGVGRNCILRFLSGATFRTAYPADTRAAVRKDPTLTERIEAVIGKSTRRQLAPA